MSKVTGLNGCGWASSLFHIRSHSGSARPSVVTLDKLLTSACLLQGTIMKQHSVVAAKLTDKAREALRTWPGLNSLLMIAIYSVFSDCP